MKSQMELALTIGTVIVGAVLLISALVLSWEMLLPATDACRIAAGIGYDVGSLQSSLFTIPGDVNIYYVPPPICEFASQLGSGSGLICQPLHGGNPNITSISVDYAKTKKYGFSFSGPAYLTVYIGFNWINNLKHNKVESSTIKIKEIATSSPGLSGSDLLSGNSITISKFQTPYGDVISNSYDDAIEMIVTSMIASAHNGNNYSDGEITLPANWFLVYNSTSNEICEYRIILNSYLYYYNYMSECAPNCNIPGNKESLVKKFGFDCSSSCSDYYYSIVYPYSSLCLSSKKTYDPWNKTNVEKYGTGFLKIRCFNISKITEDSNISYTYVNTKNLQKIKDVYSSYRSPDEGMIYKYNATYDPDQKNVSLKLWKE